MGTRTSYANGVPCWIDLGTPDAVATAAFYGALLGWEVEMDPRPEAGGYGQFTLGGKKVAGVGPQQNTEMPPFWSVYVAVDDVDATIAAAEAAGGTVVMPRMDVFTEGSMAILSDTTGSFISLWQAGDHNGCELVNDPGAFVWNELGSPDLGATEAFYRAVFGWERGEGSGEGSAIFAVDGRTICGAHAGGPGEPPFWQVWFSVEDCDAAAATATELGGTVVMSPTDMSFGRGAVVIDPQGAAFGIGAMSDVVD